MKVLKTFL